jgi:hypothetical protein
MYASRMTGRHPKAMKPRDESAHPLIEQALSEGYLDTGAVYHVDGFASHAIANQARLSMNRGGKHLNVSTPSWVTDEYGEQCYKACKDPQAPHGLRFRLHSKDSARSHVLHQSGGDPSKLKYNPFKRGQKAIIDDSGRPV